MFGLFLVTFSSFVRLKPTAVKKILAQIPNQFINLHSESDVAFQEVNVIFHSAFAV